MRHPALRRIGGPRMTADPFAGSPFTHVDLEGGYGLIAALPHAEIRDALAAINDPSSCCDGPFIVDIPVLLHEPDYDIEPWSVDMGTMRLDLVAALTPWTSSPDDKEAAGLALGYAKRAKPEAFTVMRRLVDQLAPSHRGVRG